MDTFEKLQILNIVTFLLLKADLKNWAKIENFEQL
jgi:hypothetical protein